MKRLDLIVPAIIALVTLIPAYAAIGNNEHWTVSKTMIMDASVAQVWKASKALRTTNTSEHRIVSNAGSTTQVRENFTVPIIGAVSCVYAEQESEPRSVLYRLVSSPNFIAFEGSWQFVPISDKQTSVTLTSFADTGSQLPFASRITKKQITQTVDRRMNDLKTLAE